jgi:glutamate synthase (NADPH) small chain
MSATDKLTTAEVSPPPTRVDSGQGAQLTLTEKLASVVSPNKYLWCDVPRKDPPKRPVLERAGDFKEIYGLFDEDTAQAQASRCVQCAMPFCTLGCPLGNRIPEWLGLTAEGRFLEAAAVSQSTSNLPEICSRVCPQERLCEGMCAIVERSDPIPIGAIEKFINEYAFAHGAIEIPRTMPNGFRVAVVGSGPAGLACADELAIRGYAVTVFESLNHAGGLLVNGIPSFKLEKAVVDRRLEVLSKRGVEFRTNTTVGKDVAFSQVMADYDAVFLGQGAQQAKALDVTGGHLTGVYQALHFLVEKNLGAITRLPPIPVKDQRVLVLGGGDTAMDCLRTAIRSGARETICVYRRDLANMPGSRKEYKNAIEEGARFLFLTNPLALEGNSHDAVQQVRCIRMALGEPDAKGRRKVHPVPGSEFSIPADIVLVAYGFDPVPFPQGDGWTQIAVNDWGGVMVDENQMTSLPKVFSGGDQVRGANLVVYAVRDGRRAAVGIHRYLNGDKTV